MYEAFALGSLSMATVSIIAVLFLVRYYELRLEGLQNENEELELMYSSLITTETEDEDEYSKGF